MAGLRRVLLWPIMVLLLPIMAYCGALWPSVVYYGRLWPVRGDCSLFTSMKNVSYRTMSMCAYRISCGMSVGTLKRAGLPSGILVMAY